MAFAPMIAHMRQMGEDKARIVQKRVKLFKYLQTAHQAKVHWLNVLIITKADIEKHYPKEKLQKRIQRWYILGLSVAKLLKMKPPRRKRMADSSSPSSSPKKTTSSHVDGAASEAHGALIVRALYQLLEEYEHYIGRGEATRQVGLVLGKIGLNKYDEEEPMKPAIRRVGGHVVYDHLLVPRNRTPCSMDYCEVVFSLCEVMIHIYHRFMDESCDVLTVQQMIIKIDKRVKTLIISKICGSLSTVAKPLLNIEIKKLATMFLSEGTDDYKDDEPHDHEGSDEDEHQKDDRHSSSQQQQNGPQRTPRLAAVSTSSTSITSPGVSSAPIVT